MTDLTLLPAATLARRIADREVSAVAVMTAYLDRIEALNPRINAIVSLRPRDDLLSEAAAKDAGPVSGPLHGLPMAPKDLMETKGLRTTQGTPHLSDHVPDRDDAMAATLRAAGAIFIGKTNTPEFGLGSHTYNPVHGPTRNPYDETRSAGGSSGGAGAALAARFLPLADGSDMMGSLRNPAGWNNVYGFRPSYGMVPKEPRGDSFLHQLSTMGPMARDPDDLALLLDVMARPDARLPHPAPVSEPLSNRRIGWVGDWNGYLPMEPGVLDLCESALATLDNLGWEITPLVPNGDPEKIWQSWITLRSWAVAMELAPYYENPAIRDSLKPEAIWEIERGLSLSAQDIHAASVLRSDWFRSFTTDKRVGCFALPSAQCFAFDAEIDWPRSIAGKNMDTYHRWMEVVIPASLIGVPAVCVPAGFAGNAAMGLQFLAPRGRDDALIDLARVYHAQTDWPAKRRV